MSLILKERLRRQADGRQPGVYSVCSAHPLVIEAAMRQALDDGGPLLIEATCNQVNQFGGYTGLQPADFIAQVRQIADQVGLPRQQLIFGGDHLGPNPWRDRPAAEALALARDLLAAYAAAGFTKLHLDASMGCADDPPVLSDETVAARAAELCAAAEAVAPGVAVYVIGTEVPVPGGATEELDHLQVTTPEAARHTLAVHRAAWDARGLGDAWSRVIALVVQPGVEFDHTRVIGYRPEAAAALSAVQKAQADFVFEAHSTDYQTGAALTRLVQDGFALLKVGPGLTFALREGLYALEMMERELVARPLRSALRLTVEREMLLAPSDWTRYYGGDAHQQEVLRAFSYSDRVRYYWGRPEIVAAERRLMDNLGHRPIPENLVSQYLPLQYEAYRAGQLGLDAHSLLMDKIRAALRPYAAACPPP
ncbi:MAG: hypothetical protein RL223_4619 [Pseudomonadota bacterium]|jgi:D-tagatose-1,6-bisphosphate aldolase subunit GatZ/KbaZ